MPQSATTPRRRKQAELAAASRHHPERVDELRRDYAFETLDEHIRRVVESAPPLTAEQRERLASLLRPAASPRTGGAA